MFISGLAGAGASGSASGLAADDATGSGGFTVMTQNLYLGADVAGALELLPDVAAAAEDLWSQVSVTDFPSRVPALAREVAAANPAVIGLQEATTWSCTPDGTSEPVAVYDFTAEYLAATASAGPGYVVASRDGQQALSPGYAIAPIVGATVVEDPDTFQPLFGTDSASCGFSIADALLVRADLAERVTAVGIQTYDATLDIIPGFITIQRGYAWADLDLDGTVVRFVTTHLESVWEPGVEPLSVVQARQLVADHAGYTGPLVVMGDMNADPRDPRGLGVPNPGGQPEASEACEGRACNAYWLIVDAGYTDAGPDATDPANTTWGADALLAGPDLDRLAAADAENPVGYTDRLDYVFVRNGLAIASARVTGRDWPAGDTTWACNDPAQVTNTQAAAETLGVTVPEGGVCLASDHAALVAEVALAVEAGSADDDGGSAVPWIAGGFVVGVVAVVAVALARRRRTD